VAVDFKLRRLLRLVDLVLANPDSALNDDLTYQIVEKSSVDLPEAMKTVIAHHESRATAAIAALGELAIWLLLATLGTLTFAGAFVFRPLVTRAVERTLDLLDAEEELEHNVQHDRLTGLPNRIGAQTLYEARVKLRAGQRATALHLDLPGLTMLRDAHGHGISEEVLQVVAQRLREVCRKNDVLARIGDDEFVLVLPNGNDQPDVVALAERIQATLSTPVTLDTGETLRTACRVGVAQEDAEDATFDRLLSSALIAMNDAEDGSEGGVSVYSPAMRDQVEEKDRTLRELDAAIDSGEILPFFQPQIHADTGVVSGFEALVRWQHPERGLIPPFKFIDIAEEGGLGSRLGALMLARSLEAVNRWDAAGFHVPQIGVNFSSGQLMDPKIVDHIKLEMDRCDLSPDRLGIEILETVMVEKEDHVVVDTVLKLKAAGFRMELDDFGTGHASISNLRRFQVDRIKIDRGFVTGIDSDAKQRKMVLAMIRMADGLGIKALAEGIETPGERQALLELGIHNLQGYGIGRPMPFADTIGWLTENKLFETSRRRRTG
jgi:diguanylate cyclase (GGDEF)-like protein